MNPITQKMRALIQQETAYAAAQAIQKLAAAEGFDWRDPREVLTNVNDEVAEISEELEKSELNRIRLLDEYSDLLFVVLGLARHFDLNPDDVLNYANQKFVKRFAGVEAMAIASGRELKEIHFDELMEYWAQAKKN